MKGITLLSEYNYSEIVLLEVREVFSDAVLHPYLLQEEGGTESTSIPPDRLRHMPRRQRPSTHHIRNSFRQSRPFGRKQKKKNALCESPNAARNYFLSECCVCIDYPNFSLNPAPSVFQFCGSLKKDFRGKHFRHEVQIEAELNRQIRDLVSAARDSNMCAVAGTDISVTLANM
jgi:hypothetical protein